MGLTSQERDILRMLAYGLTPEQIAAHCGLSRRTVTSELVAIQWKLGARSRLETIIIVLKAGLIAWPSLPAQPPDDGAGYQIAN